MKKQSQSLLSPLVLTVVWVVISGLIELLLYYFTLSVSHNVMGVIYNPAISFFASNSWVTPAVHAVVILGGVCVLGMWIWVLTAPEDYAEDEPETIISTAGPIVTYVQKIHCAAGDGSRYDFELDLRRLMKHRYSLGSDPSCDLVLRSIEGVHRRHAEFRAARGALCIKACHGHVVINGKVLQRRHMCKVHHRDVIKIGHNVLTVT